MGMTLRNRTELYGILQGNQLLASCKIKTQEVVQIVQFFED